MEMVRSPTTEEHHHSQDHHHQSQLTPRTEQVMMISKLRSRKLFSIEKYLSYIHSRDCGNFTVDHLNTIVSIHGFKKLDKRKQSEEAVRAIKPINPQRSTLEDNIPSSFKANITINEAIKDLRSLNWQECSITSIKTINKQYHDIVANIPAKNLPKDGPPKAATAKKKQQQQQLELASSMSCSSSGPSSSNSTSDTHTLALALPAVVVNTSAVRTRSRRPVLKRRKLSSFTTTSCSGSSL